MKNNYMVEWVRCGNVKIWLMFIVCLVVYLLNLDKTFAQAPAPYSYSTPDFTKIFTHESDDVNGTYLRMSSVNKPPEGADAFMVEFYAEMDLVKNSKLLKFSVANTIILEVFYHDYTMKLRRYLTNDKYYDYVLYDALFCMADASGEPCRNYSPAKGVWHVKFYFSSGFMWFQVTKEGIANRNYLSPLFFGLDFSSNSYMESFLQRSDRALITFGSHSNYSGFKMPKGDNIYAMKYDDLRKDIQKNFSKVHSASTDKAPSAKRASTKDIKHKIDNVKDNKIIIYPNPVNGNVLNLDISLKQNDILHLSLIDISGKVVFQQKKYALKGGQTMQLDNLPKLTGVYILRIRSKNMNLTKKVLFN